MKMAKRYLLRGDREAGEGKPFRAISDYKTSWKNSILAVKWALKDQSDNASTEDPGEDQLWPDIDSDCPEVCTGPSCKQSGWFKGPWWLWWYVAYGTGTPWKNNGPDIVNGNQNNCWDCWK